MVAGFGFSVGDFIAAINLFRQVGSALKENGGARNDYLKTINKLEGIKAILSCIADLKDDSKDSATAHAIRNLASLIQNDVECFISEVKTYQKTLGSAETKRFGATAITEVKWSQSMAGKVERLYKELDSKIASLSLLFELHLSDAAIEGRNDLASTRNAILDAIENRSTVPNIPIRPTSDDTSLKKYTDAVVTGLQKLESGYTESVHKTLSALATKNDIQMLKSTLESRLQPVVLTQSEPLVSKDVSRFSLASTIPNLGFSPRQMMISLLPHFSGDFTVLLKVFLTYFMVCFKALLLALPQLILLCRRLPPAISLILHDNITFEDALGRVQSLQFQQFRHWAVFESSLRCAFEFVPGRQKVIRGDYVLRSPGQGNQLTSRNWSLIVRPGSVVKMAIVLTQIFGDGPKCPRGCRSVMSDTKSMGYCCCKNCGLVFAVRRRSNTKLQGESSSLNRCVVESTKSIQMLLADAIRNHNLLEPDESTLDEETKELKAFKRVELDEPPLRVHSTQQPAAHLPTSTHKRQTDESGQTRPPRASKRRDEGDEGDCDGL